MAQTLGGKATNANEPVDGSPIKEVTTTSAGTKTGVDVSIVAGDIEIGAIEIKDGTTDERANVVYDGFYSALAITDGRMVFDVDDDGIAKSQIPQDTISLNYGFDTTEDIWSRFKVEIDNDSIPAGQTTQLINGLMYYFDDKTSKWMRWRGDAGSMWTTVIGLYTPTFDSVMDDTLDTVKVSNDTAVNLKVDGSDVTQPVSGAVTVSGTATVSGTVSVSNMIPSVETGLATSALQLPDDHNVTVSNMIPAVETGLATSALQLADGHNVTANAGTNLNTSALSLSANQGKWNGAVSGLTTWKEADGKPRISQQPYLYDIAEENIIGHKGFYKIGYNPIISNVEETIWPYGGKYAFMKGESILEVASSDNTQDIGSILFNRTSTGGSTTTLEDSAVDFTAGANPVAVLDTVILDKSGATPEWGYVTGVTANTLTISGGFSSGGTGDARDYIVLNRTAYTGCQAVYIGYLDSDFVLHNEIVILNGTTAVNTINSDYYRINDMIIIAAGTLEASLGTIQLRDPSSTPVYSQITIGYTRARTAVFTVPYGKVLYVTTWNSSWASPNDSKVQSARVILRCNREPQNNFLTNSIFYPVAETLVTNENVPLELDVPLRFVAGTDITISCISTNAAGTGPATTVIRGWVENS